MFRLILSLSSFVLVACSALTAAADDASPDAVGRPETFAAGKVTACAVWFEDGQWHVSATRRAKQKGAVTFVGAIRVESGKILGGSFQGLEASKRPADSDWLSVDPDRTGLRFQLVNRGQADGFTFNVSDYAKTVTFLITVRGDNNPQQVLIGRSGAHPEKIPFTLPARPVTPFGE